MNGSGSGHNSSGKARRIVLPAALGAIGFVLMLFEIRLPLFPEFLKYDAGDVPALLTGSLLGPAGAAWAEVVKNVLFFLSGRGASGWIGSAANLVAGLALVVPFALLARRGVSQIVALTVGILSTTVVMVAANYYFFFPAYGLTGSAATKLLVASIIPFNLLKGFLSSVVMVLIARRLPAHLFEATAPAPVRLDPRRAQ